MMTSRARPWLLVSLLLGLMATASIVTLIGVRLMNADGWATHDQLDGHHWLHEKLGLTPDEAAAIDAFETPYREEKAKLSAEFQDRIENLATLLRESDAVTPEVTHAVHELHRVHGQLQELSIRHYFEMLSVLPPEKQAQLRTLAVEALSTPR